MKKLTIFAVALVALGLGSTADARVGGYSQKLLYALESVTDYNTSTTATCIKGYTFRKNTLFDGQVLILEAAGTVGVTSTPNLTVSVKMGNTIMITSSTIAVTAGYFKIRAVGVVRTIDSVSSGTRTAGTILWSLEFDVDQTTNVEFESCDETADSVQTNIDNQDLTLEFTWSASSASNTLKTEQFCIFSY